MALIDVVMPKMGESIMECTVIAWLKQPGEPVETDESLLEVATDKVDTEVPSPQGGILKEQLVKDGEVVAIGAAIARIETDQPETTDSPSEPETETDQPLGIGDVANVPDNPNPPAPTPGDAARQLEAEIETLQTPTPEAYTSLSSRFYSPLVLNIAKAENITRDELDRITGTGAEQRVTKNDVLAYVSARQAKPQPAATAPAPSVNGASDLIQMDRMRRMIAERMLASQQTSAHVSSFVEADVTPMVAWREKNKEVFQQQTGQKLTYTPMLIDAIVKALRDFPMMNISVEGEAIRVHRGIHIGMAVALPNDNLIVPVIHNAEQYNLVGLAAKVNELSHRARIGKLSADDLTGGTYTISNIGMFGNLMGTPIIVQPQVAIMAFGAIVKKPAVIETPKGDFIGIRQLMFLSHSYDHRVVDGALGGRFVRRVADYLEQFTPPTL